MYNVFYPGSPVTQRHIVNYDRLRPFGRELPVRYFAFPQKGVTVFVLKNATIVSENNQLTISRSDEENLKVVFLGKYIQPLLLTYTDVVEETAINFTETGIHYFFPDQWMPSHPVTILDGADLNLDAGKLFTGDETTRLRYLEDYLTGRYSPVDTAAVEKAIALINDDPGRTVAAIAEQVFLTEKTLNRRFQKQVGCTISGYRHIVRFRNTIDSHFSNTTTSLTELCLENDYFDSPHFYKQVKKIAHFNPRDFFHKVTANGLGAYPYIFD